MAFKELTATEIKNLKVEKRTDVKVSDKLFLAVNPESNSKKWVYKYTLNGRTVRYKGFIGEYPAVSLAEAKEKRNELMKIEDPNAALETSEANKIVNNVATAEALKTAALGKQQGQYDLALNTTTQTELDNIVLEFDTSTLS